MRWLNWLFAFMLIVGGSGPPGTVFVPVGESAPQSTDEDAGVESCKIAAQTEQVLQIYRGCLRPRVCVRRMMQPLPGGTIGRSFSSASTVFLAAVNSPMNC